MSKKEKHLKIVNKTDSREIIVPSLLDVISKLTIRNHEQFTDVIKIAMKALEEKDAYTKGHSIRVTEYSVQIGKQIGLDNESMKSLELAALLHDIGKIGIPDKILKKPGRLTKQEYETMQNHSTKGETMINEISGLAYLTKYIRSHHERYDGFGYPDGTKGKEIPLISRILLLADTYDAMTSTRPYRKGLTVEVTFEELVRCKNTQFDPELVDAFIESFKTKTKKKAG